MCAQRSLCSPLKQRKGKKTFFSGDVRARRTPRSCAKEEEKDERKWQRPAREIPSPTPGKYTTGRTVCTQKKLWQTYLNRHKRFPDILKEQGQKGTYRFFSGTSCIRRVSAFLFLFSPGPPPLSLACVRHARFCLAAPTTIFLHFSCGPFFSSSN